MEAVIKKWGNSLAIRIPISVSREAGIDDGTIVNIQVEDEVIMIKPYRKKYHLKDLLNQVNESNIHGETQTGGALGKEIW